MSLVKVVKWWWGEKEKHLMHTHDPSHFSSAFILYFWWKTLSVLPRDFRNSWCLYKRLQVDTVYRVSLQDLPG